MQPTRLDPDPQNPGGTPAFGGCWRGDPDGGWTPLDEGTAIGAGLAWPAEPAAPAAPN